MPTLGGPTPLAPTGCEADCKNSLQAAAIRLTGEMARAKNQTEAFIQTATSQWKTPSQKFWASLKTNFDLEKKLATCPRIRKEGFNLDITIIASGLGLISILGAL